VPCAQIEATIGRALSRKKVCMSGAERSHCHMLAVSLETPDNVLIASMSPAARPHCILNARDFGMLAIFSDRSCGGAEDFFNST
jgi:hypothetical protein